MPQRRYFEIRASSFIGHWSLVIRHFFYFCAWVFCLLGAQASAGEIEQRRGNATLRVEAASVESGRLLLRLSEKVKVTLSVDGGSGLTVEPIQLLSPSKDWHVSQKSKPEIIARENGARWQQAFYLDPLKPGEHSLVVAPLRFRDKAGTHETRWSPIPARVVTEITTADLSELRDITPPEVPPAKPSSLPLLAWCAAILLSVCFLAGIGQYFRRRLQRRPAVPADEWALSELRLLQSSTAATADEVEALHIQLTGVLRRYVELRFQVPAPARTTQEFLDLLKGTSLLTADQHNVLMELLERGDLVKFAQTMPAAEECHALMAKACEFVTRTAARQPTNGNPHLSGA